MRYFSSAVRVLIPASILALLALSTGCASGSGQSAGVLAQKRALEETAPDTLPIFDGETGDAITWSEVVERASGADVVVIGEMHGHPVGLATAAALFDRIVHHRPDAALSLEFFDRDRQIALDDFLVGITDEDAFRKAAGRTDGNYPPGHRKMVERAKEADLPVYSANAPRRYLKIAREENAEMMEAMTDEQRRLIVFPEVLTEGAYRDRFFDRMSGLGGHGDEEDGKELTDEEKAEKEAAEQKLILTYFRSQNIWDATMADSVARALAAGRRPVVQVIGQFHSDFNGGFVQRVKELAPDAEIFTISMAESDDAAFDSDDLHRASVVIHVGEAPE